MEGANYGKNECRGLERMGSEADQIHQWGQRRKRQGRQDNEAGGGQRTQHGSENRGTSDEF